MSGFGGIVQTGERSIDLKNVERMMGALRPYGPDSQKTLYRPRVGMLHTLMRVTPEDFFERQPLSSVGGYLLSADARIDNRAELAGKLAIHPAQLKTMPDSQLILKAYEKWEEQCPEHLLGDFSFAIWDSKRQVLFAAVDHFGIRPFFYSKKSDVFAFANDIKAMLALPDISHDLNEQKLAEFIVLLHADASASFYKDITRLPAGHCLSVSPQKMSVRRYYCLEESIQDIHFSNPGDYAEGLKEKLNEAVLCRLRSAHQVGCELSGGLDSTSVAGLAALELARSGKELQTYTAIPPLGYQGTRRKGWELDERPFVEMMGALHPNIHLNFVEFDPAASSLFKNLENTYGLQGFPNRNVTSIWLNELALNARDSGARVMLNAGRGNIGISWAGKCLYSELIDQKRWSEWSKKILEAWLGRHRSLTSLMKASFLPFVPDIVWNRFQHMRTGEVAPWFFHSLVSPDLAERSSLLDRFKELEWDPHYRPLPRGRAVRIRQITRGASCDASDQSSVFRSLTGVERRDPTHDKRVIEYCFGIEEAEYCRGGQARSLIRDAMKDVVPKKILYRQSRGMQPPSFSARLHEPSSELWAQVEALEGSSQVKRFLDVPKMKVMLQRSLDGGANGQEAQRIKRTLERAYSVGGFIRYVEGENE
ncbi:Asparagine synthetase [glutamine-hydrolyzing] 3 [BD1-7 clade bacterium]|uniref:asparagine synthase (glutamine-hydrolyzing) n=1 Tax=BD1-7 clade bacterium TaxID=2029982 RepID=A0A5S9NW30_9GAMM|nr:Asparagine synthetase [glutamine-hydrolyzing] 3 [BD1-7 clade bacterium]